jgi:hypothetical protein
MRPSRAASIFEQRTLRGGCALGSAAIILAFLEPASISTASRLAVFACLAPALGCLVFTLIHRITGGQWTAGIAPFLGAGVSLLPWIWAFAAPVLLVSRRTYDTGLAYDGLGMLAARAVLVGAYFFWIKRALSAGVGSERDARTNVRPWAGPVGLILLFFLLTFLADDWLESLEEGWHSTGFTVVWIAGQAVSGLALCLLCGLGRGVRPPMDGSAGRPLGLDWGNLMLATVMFWTYVAFAQFLIIWAGNLPEETSWYLRRQHGLWAWVPPSVALLGFALPFFMLLSRRLKGSARGLATVALLLLASQLAYISWVIVPIGVGSTAGGGLLELTLLAGALALFANRFASLARKTGETQ